jgi:hypothetical protein
VLLLVRFECLLGGFHHLVEQARRPIDERTPSVRVCSVGLLEGRRLQQCICLLLQADCSLQLVRECAVGRRGAAVRRTRSRRRRGDSMRQARRGVC